MTLHYVIDQSITGINISDIKKMFGGEAKHNPKKSTHTKSMLINQHLIMIFRSYQIHL